MQRCARAYTAQVLGWRQMGILACQSCTQPFAIDRFGMQDEKQLRRVSTSGPVVFLLRARTKAWECCRCDRQSELVCS